MTPAACGAPDGASPDTAGGTGNSGINWSRRSPVGAGILTRVRSLVLARPFGSGVCASGLTSRTAARNASVSRSARASSPVDASLLPGGVRCLAMIVDPIAQGVQRYSIVRKARPASKGACLSILRGRDRGRFPLKQGGADAVGYAPNKEATTPHEGKSARSRRVGKALCWCATVVFDRAGGSVRWGVCGVARLVHSTHYGLRRAPCIRSRARIQWGGPGQTASHGYTALPTRLTRKTRTGSKAVQS